MLIIRINRKNNFFLSDGLTFNSINIRDTNEEIITSIIPNNDDMIEKWPRYATLCR